ncbi:DUF6090 family protein [Winogradskyella sp.]|uniref:DUF6090 family protein n=1 Tax=Winogradskyella sp. TaxID=1883156 RepID=UPI001B1C416F|nr:DUF6090 family protein [Winogradskyella sp.]MBO6881261.1 hypothetical protein [Winogradskyella sp.]
MIKFFRRIRYNLMAQSKTSKYFKYAVGEIVLVVIGILIALSINNWNEDRKAAEKSKTLLQQIHKELAFNIGKANNVIEQYRSKDKLVFDVVNRNVNYEYYTNKGMSAFIILSQEAVEIADDAFKNLMDKQDDFTKEQDSIISKLKEIYGTNKKRVDLTDDIATNLVLEYFKNYKNEKKWYYNMIMNNQLNDEAINYLLTDSTYLNLVANFQIINLNNHKRYTNIFRRNALDTYEELSNYLKIVMDTTIIKNSKAYDHYLGTYTNGIRTHEIIRANNKLLSISYSNSNPENQFVFNFYPDSKHTFMMRTHLFGELSYNSKNEVIGFTVSNGSQRREFKKIK